jgi:phosphoribosylaminoimidazole-succinocarboxamide synthase
MESHINSAMSKSAGKSLSGGDVELQGTSKDLRSATRPGTLFLQFKAESLPQHAPAAEEDAPRASLANEISSYLFGYLHGYKIPTHFLATENATTMLVRQLEMFPLCVRVWNTAGTNYARRFGIRDGMELPFPVIEHFFRKSEAPYPLVNEFHLYSLGVVTPEDLRIINRLACKTNAVLRSLFARRGLKLHSLILEFGSADGQIMLGDELTPRTFVAGEANTRSRKGRDILCGADCPPAVVYRQMRDRLLAVPAGTLQP